MLKFSLKERREKFLFFTGMFLVTSVILCVAIFYNYGSEGLVSKSEFAKKVTEEEQFESLVTEALPTVDTTYHKIVKFNPNVQAVFLENDISGSIGAVKSYYNRRPYDARYKCFIHASKLLQALFYDKRELTGNYNDIRNIKGSVDDCHIAQRQLQQNMSLAR
ncbi:type VI secretion system transmembrane protein TssO [Mucilaginibacter sp. cycad4]|uniref:type VI secretion system transmembrane protein TssO n=1 Tax=Mucilaginibacter sp. cycad4 TaxID=3342096 RepID=UPI002AABA0B7|nr:type VI secretion system transmembrane protein TssO [Mucilaginibacter gossypii]WPU97489.1 type VI secretion system transmembrane protein TssO [Mucilaginibacter gossypii]